MHISVINNESDHYLGLPKQFFQGSYCVPFQEIIMKQPVK